MIDVGSISLYLVSLMPLFLMMVLDLKKSLHMAQQNSYNKDYHFLKWVIKDVLEFYTSYKLYLVLLASILLFGIIKINNTLIFRSFIVIITLVVTFLKIHEDKQNTTKIELKYTARVKRLIVTYLVLTIALISYSTFKCSTNMYLSYFLLYFYNFIIHFIMILVLFINKPIEKMVYNGFKNKAVKKLQEFKDLKVVGVTGSFGKTSSKNILAEILSIKYNALPSPKSFNTPYGLIITVNDHLDKFDDILIAEMGARRQGEIKELCDLVKPKYGIITRIGEAHLESFGSMEVIEKTKFELIESLPSDGIGVINIDDEYQLNHKIENDCKIITIGIQNKDADVIAKDIKTGSEGTTFKVKFKKSRKSYEFTTKLLGVANIYNILASLALAKEFGLTEAEMQKAVSKVKPIEHRLELREAGNITFIDDAFNANPLGAKMALDVLESMPDKRVIITPGMVELGEMQYELNKEFGRQMKDKCDEIILVGKKQTKPIQDGLEEIKFNQNRIHVVKNLDEALGIVRDKYKDKKVYVLLENDLPDAFNEKE